MYFEIAASCPPPDYLKDNGKLRATYNEVEFSIHVQYVIPRMDISRLQNYVGFRLRISCHHECYPRNDPHFECSDPVEPHRWYLRDVKLPNDTDSETHDYTGHYEYKIYFPCCYHIQLDAFCDIREYIQQSRLVVNLPIFSLEEPALADPVSAWKPFNSNKLRSIPENTISLPPPMKINNEVDNENGSLEALPNYCFNPSRWNAAITFHGFIGESMSARLDFRVDPPYERALKKFRLELFASNCTKLDCRDLTPCSDNLESRQIDLRWGRQYHVFRNLRPNYYCVRLIPLIPASWIPCPKNKPSCWSSRHSDTIRMDPLALNSSLTSLVSFSAASSGKIITLCVVIVFLAIGSLIGGACLARVIKNRKRRKGILFKEGARHCPLKNGDTRTPLLYQRSNKVVGNSTLTSTNDKSVPGTLLLCQFPEEDEKHALQICSLVTLMKKTGCEVIDLCDEAEDFLPEQIAIMLEEPPSGVNRIVFVTSPSVHLLYAQMLKQQQPSI
ncbi:unnamed protein product [Cyprideis torosa]|uniref:Uncharacterized protein n=1 Tax=Cyprideis torosa TaxID=163714 RepID=A0A7R8W814_9CRUS|nr:unnamed protein product [Cyprideis torosa]CAG0883315.1 unnamed protein product [Cyprideis torosa]